MNIREACNKWVTSEMSAIPMSVVEKLYDCGHYNDITTLQKSHRQQLVIEFLYMMKMNTEQLLII